MLLGTIARRKNVIAICCCEYMYTSHPSEHALFATVNYHANIISGETVAWEIFLRCSFWERKLLLRTISLPVIFLSFVFSSDLVPEFPFLARRVTRGFDYLAPYFNGNDSSHAFPVIKTHLHKAIDEELLTFSSCRIKT